MFTDSFQDISSSTVTLMYAIGGIGLFLLVVGYIRSQCSKDEFSYNALTAIMLFGAYMMYLLISGGLATVSTGVVQKVMDNINPMTIGFINVILFFGIYFHVKYNTAVVYKAPAILMTLGILGTFVGIAVGLADFDPNDIQKSVPALINGIKTAFWASAFGIFCALTIKLRDILFGGSSRRIADTKSANNANINDLVSILKSIQQSLAGNDEATVTHQIYRARQDNNMRLDTLIRSMDGLKTSRVGGENPEFAAKPSVMTGTGR